MVKKYLIRIFICLTLIILFKDKSKFIIDNLKGKAFKKDEMIIDSVVPFDGSKKNKEYMFSGTLVSGIERGTLFELINKIDTYSDTTKYFIENKLYGTIKIGSRVPVWYLLNNKSYSFYLRNPNETPKEAFLRIWLVMIVVCATVNSVSMIVIIHSIFTLCKRYI